MATPKLTLTASNIKYLLVLYDLCQNNSGTRGVRIAETLGITKPSVHTMMDTLKTMKLVRKDPYGEIYLTNEGLETARKYNSYYGTLHDCFKTFMDNEADVRSAVCAVMAEVATPTLDEMCLKIQCKDTILRNKGDNYANS